MKRHALCGPALALVLLCGPAMAADVYMSADDYMMGTQEERWGFVQGVYDTYGAMARLGSIAECATKVSVNELEQTFTTWLESNADRWNEKMPSLFLVALGAQCNGSSPIRVQDVNAEATD